MVFKEKLKLIWRRIMKWVDDIKDSASAFKEWGRLLTIIGVVMAVSLVIIAIELLVICIRL